MKAHKLSLLFPEMDAGAFAALVESIRERGQEDAIVLFEGAILDGRNRWKACKAAGVEPKTKEYRGSDPLGYVVAKNLDRRHLDESQRAMGAARLATLRQGQGKGTNSDLSTPDAAGKLNVGRNTVLAAKKVLAEGSPDLVRAVDSGKIAVSAAKDLVALPDSEQAEIALELDEKLRRQKVAAGKKRAKHAAKKPAEKKPKELSLSSTAQQEQKSWWTVEEWNKLTPSRRDKIIMAGFESRDEMTEQEGDSIEWARHSMNTVTGCLHDCPYCYARDIAERFFSYKFQPVFHPTKLAAPANTKFPSVAAAQDHSYQNVFANSMSDLFGKWVPKDWIESTIEMARRNEQWNFLTLTKFPQRAADFEYPDNLWVGTTVDAQARVDTAERAFDKIQCKTKWLSLEPLLEPLRFSRLDLFQWVVIGGSSRSTKTPEWFPPFEWVSRLHSEAKEAGCSVYHKTNLGLFDVIRVREFPWRKNGKRSLPESFKYLKGMK